METIKLGSEDSRPKRVTIVSFSTQLIKVPNKYHAPHLKMLKNTLRVTNWLEWLQVNKVLLFTEPLHNFLQMLLLLTISQPARISWSPWFTFMVLWPVLTSTPPSLCNLLVTGISALYQTWWMKHAHGQLTKTETIFGSKMMLWKQRTMKKFLLIKEWDSKRREFHNVLQSVQKLRIKDSLISLD